MEPLDKLEMIFHGLQGQKRTERGRCNENSPYGANTMYVHRLDAEIDMLTVVLDKLQAVRNNHPNVRDEIVLKMYGSKN